MATDAGHRRTLKVVFFSKSAEKSIIYLVLCPKEIKEKEPDKMLLGWLYCVTYPILLNHVLCILHTVHWTHPLPSCSTSSFLVGSFSPCHIPTLQGTKMQHSQSITHYKWYICYFVELEELLGLNFCIPYCEKNTLVHFFPLEKHRHKMQLILRPMSYCNSRNCKHWGIFSFLPFYSDTWVAVYLSFLH